MDKIKMNRKSGGEKAGRQAESPMVREGGPGLNWGDTSGAGKRTPLGETQERGREEI